MAWIRENIGGFLGDMFRHWVGQLTGILSIVLGAFPVINPSFFSGDQGILHSRTMWWLVASVAFLFAAQAAWSEKKALLRDTEKKLEDAIDTSRPEVTAEFTMGPTNHAYMNGGPQVQVINRGSDVAWQPRIEDVVIGGHIVSFHCPSILEKDKPHAANCFIKGVDANSANGLEHLLHTQAQKQLGKEAIHGKGTEVHPDSYKVSFDLRVRWADSRGNGFMSLGKVTYLYTNRTARTEFPFGICRLPKQEQEGQ